MVALRMRQAARQRLRILARGVGMGRSDMLRIVHAAERGAARSGPATKRRGREERGLAASNRDAGRAAPVVVLENAVSVEA